VSSFIQLWKRLQPGARFRIVLAVMAIGALTAWFAYQTMRVEYAVLFSQLSEADAATIVDQLKKQKALYRIAGGGTAIEVPADRVHETRLSLMSGGVPLSGGIGFEIFDKQGLGATEQSQRVSYQRALQGELARTIGTLDGVRQARVHLVLPESSLFRRDRQEARAAVTLTMNRGTAPSREQILGVQRLVAASVPGLDPGRVVLTDQRGITLSGPDALGGEGMVSERRLAMKRDIEEYLTRKIARLLDSTYGPGQAIVSVDVLLNFDEIRRTVQDAQPSGVRRRRQVMSGNPADDPGAAAIAGAVDAPAPGNSSTDIEYEYGRKVEQVISAPGGVSRISVGVVVPVELTAEKQQRVTELVRMAAGINEQRGDAVVVQPLYELNANRAPAAVDVEAGEQVPIATDAPVSSNVAWWKPWATDMRSWMLLAFVVIGLIVVAVVGRMVASRSRAAEPPALSPQERQNLLLEIQKVLESGSTPPGTRARP
jgi:flagellar M-ring protein FliF